LHDVQTARATGSLLGDDPNGMDDAGDVAKQGQQDVDPEVFANTNLEKDAERGQDYREDYPYDIHRSCPDY
jgi:hypothetical protein